MKILLVVHSYLPRYFAGTEGYTYNLAQELARQGNEVKIFTVEPRTLKKDRQTEKYHEGRVEVVKVHNPHAKPPQKLIETILKNDYTTEFTLLLDKYKPDIVHIQHLIGLSIEFIDLIKQRDIKVIYTAHDLWHRCPTLRSYIDGAPCRCKANEACGTCAGTAINSFLDYNKVENPIVKFLLRLDWKIQRRKRNRLFRKQLAKVDMIIAPSKFLINDLRNYGINESKLKLVQHGIQSPGKSLVGNHIDEKGIVKFIFPSHLTVDKGFELTVNTFLELESKGIDFQLDIYGSYAKEDKLTLELLQKVGRSKNLKYKGTYDPKDKFKIFKDYNVVLVPSLWDEIYGLVLDEALALGKFAVVSNKGALPERVIDGINGFIFDPCITSDFKNKISELIINPKKAIDNSSRQKTWIPIEDHTKSVTSIYKSVL